MIRAAVLLVLLAGCGAPGRIEVTLVTDSSVSDALLGAASILRVGANGAVSFNQDVPLDPGRGLRRTERLLVEVGSGSGDETLAFSALAGAATFACSSGDTVDLASPRLTVTMHACSDEPPDMTAPGDGPDLAVPVDLSGIDMGPFVGGASKCPVGGALLCEGWEQPASSYPGSWNFGTPPTPAIDNQRVARGSQALLLALPAGTGYMGVAAGRSVPHAPPFFVRLFVNVASPAIHYTANLVRIDQTSGSFQSLNLVMDNDGALRVDTTNINPGISNSSATTFIPTDVWTCLEIGYDSLTNGNVKVWMNDVEITDVESGGLTFDAIPDEVALFYDYTATSAAPATKVWVDEVVVSTTRVGCAN